MDKKMNAWIHFSIIKILLGKFIPRTFLSLGQQTWNGWMLLNNQRFSQPQPLKHPPWWSSFGGENDDGT